MLSCTLSTDFTHKGLFTSCVECYPACGIMSSVALQLCQSQKITLTCHQMLIIKANNSTVAAI